MRRYGGIQMIVREIEVRDIMTKTNLPVSDFAVNPYVGCTHACKYCYASFMKRFTNHPEPWGEFVDVKRWPEIDRPGKYAGKEAFFCSVTDPYQPLEKKYGRTRALLTQLLPTGISVSISTKSDLILRDLDLIRQFPSAHVSWSINTLDEDFRREMDRAVSIERRLEAMRQFYEAGVETTCFISPIFPGITDVPAIIGRAKDQADLIWLENLNLRGQFKGEIMRYIDEKYLHLVPLYDEIYNKGKRGYWQDLEAQVKQICIDNDFPYLRNDLPYGRSKPGKPVIVNYFYHEEIRLNNK